MLKEWINQEGTEGRKRLLEAIRAKLPDFSHAGLTQYINGARIPDYEIAQVIADTTGIPIFLLAFRFVNRPGDKKR